MDYTKANRHSDIYVYMVEIMFLHKYKIKVKFLQYQMK